MKTGKIAENVLIRSVLKMCKSRRKEVIKGAGVGQDCAFFAFPENSYTTSSVHSQIINELADCNRAVMRAVNNIAVSGAEPVGIMVNLSLPKRIYESEIKEYMMHMEATAKELNIQITGGHTLVSDAILQTFVTVTAIGMVPTNKVCQLSNIKAGQDIVISKWIGLEGSALLARTKEELKERYPSYFVKEARKYDQYLSIIPEAAIATKSHVLAMHDASTGGIFSALWEIAEGSGVGLEVDLKQLPIKQETIEICEYFNANPYELLSGGALIMITDKGYQLAQQIKDAGIQATVVGKMIEGNEKRVRNDDEIRFLERPKKDQIDSIL